MGDKNEAPPPPDLSPVVNAFKEASTMAMNLGKEQLAWAKEQYASVKGTTDKVVDALLSSQAKLDQRADEYHQRYKDVFQPAQDRYLEDAESFSTTERQENERARAQAAVAQNYDAARQAATRQLESFGVNPASTRYAALDLGARLGRAGASAAAGNEAVRATEATGMALRSNAIGMGNGLPGQSISAAATGNSAGQGAVGSGNSTLSTGSGAMTAPSAYTGQGISAIGGMGNTINQGYQNQVDAYKANQASSSGIGSLLGGMAGLGGAFMGMPTASVGAKLLGFAEGGAVPDPSGGAIPTSASPSGGAQVDDVPARLNAGEFILPKDVVSWIGEKQLQAQIIKARNEKQGAGAKPAIGRAPAQAPAVRTAIPMGAAA